LRMSSFPTPIRLPACQKPSGPNQQTTRHPTLTALL
jgi:hypothetical protein